MSAGKSPGNGELSTSFAAAALVGSHGTGRSTGSNHLRPYTLLNPCAHLYANGPNVHTSTAAHTHHNLDVLSASRRPSRLPLLPSPSSSSSLASPRPRPRPRRPSRVHSPVFLPSIPSVARSLAPHGVRRVGCPNPCVAIDRGLLFPCPRARAVVVAPPSAPPSSTSSRSRAACAATRARGVVMGRHRVSLVPVTLGAVAVAVWRVVAPRVTGRTKTYASLFTHTTRAPSPPIARRAASRAHDAAR